MYFLVWVFRWDFWPFFCWHRFTLPKLPLWHQWLIPLAWGYCFPWHLAGSCHYRTLFTALSGLQVAKFSCSFLPTVQTVFQTQSPTCRLSGAQQSLLIPELTSTNTAQATVQSSSSTSSTLCFPRKTPTRVCVAAIWVLYTDSPGSQCSFRTPHRPPVLLLSVGGDARSKSRSSWLVARDRSYPLPLLRVNWCLVLSLCSYQSSRGKKSAAFILSALLG